MVRRRKEEEAAPGAPAWMATFGDLMSLLLTFFVLLISFSTIQEENYNAAMGSLKGAFGIFENPFEKIQFAWRLRMRALTYRYRFIRHGNIVGYKKRKIPLVHKKNEYVNSLTDMSDEVIEYTKKEGLADLVAFDYYEKGLKIRLPNVILFEEGTSNIKDDVVTKTLLGKIIKLLKNLPYGVSVEGHTDNRRISNPRFDSNWSLASDRAMSVLKYFVKNGVEPFRLEAVSCGEYKPISDNDTLFGRKLNRRVEINLDASVIMK